MNAKTAGYHFGIFSAVILLIESIEDVGDFEIYRLLNLNFLECFKSKNLIGNSREETESKKLVNYG